jgi:hypothetical protein
MVTFKQRGTGGKSKGYHHNSKGHWKWYHGMLCFRISTIINGNLILKFKFKSDDSSEY